MNQLTIGGIVTNAISIGLKNLGSLVGAVILWLVTIWIPYLNIGTTIGMIGIVVAMSKGSIFSPTEIFNPNYRKHMGEFFLLGAFLYFGTMTGALFFIIPGIVISIAWGQAIYLLLDKGYNPTECLAVSNRITYGKKWTIFLGTFILVIALFIALYILYLIFDSIWGFLGGLVMVVGYIAVVSIMIGASAYIYGVLSPEADSGSTASAGGAATA